MQVSSLVGPNSNVEADGRVRSPSSRDCSSARIAPRLARTQADSCASRGRWSGQ